MKTDTRHKQLERLQKLNDAAQRELRSDPSAKSLPPKDTQQKDSRQENNGTSQGLIAKLSEHGALTVEEQAEILRARWINADLHDHRGNYQAARVCLGDIGPVRKAIDHVSSNPDRGPSEYLMVHQLWLLLMESVADHRDGLHAKAIDTTRKLRAALDFLPAGEYLDLRARVEYALGRHLQSDGQPDEAEQCFTRGIEFCESAYVLAENDENTAYTRFLTAIFVVGLARNLLARGELTRALRQTLIARTLMPKRDRVYLAYLDFLKGATLRQLNDLPKAIACLLRAVEVFEQENHERYFQRARYELAKAYYNQRSFEAAIATLIRQLKGTPSFTGDLHTQHRWKASKLILEARIAYELHDYAAAATNAEAAHGALRDFPAKSSDLRALIQIERAKVALKLGKFDDAVTHCNTGLALKTDDANDRGWLLLVLTEAHLLRREIDSVNASFDRWKKIEPSVENYHILEYADQLRPRVEREASSFYVAFDATDAADLNYDALWNKLRYFLVRRVQEGHKGEKIETQAQILGVSRQTLANWMSEMRKPKKPAT
jgi:tetratricopeptide (TPR) repeat protein